MFWVARIAHVGIARIARRDKAWVVSTGNTE